MMPSSHFRRKPGARRTTVRSPPTKMRLPLILALSLALLPLGGALAQAPPTPAPPAGTATPPAAPATPLAGTGDFHIVWEAKDRFRLFRNDADFQRLVAANRAGRGLPPEYKVI